jgi:hypothetical protein
MMTRMGSRSLLEGEVWIWGLEEGGRWKGRGGGLEVGLVL